MADVLYRKYRSRNFAEVQGQEAVLTVVINSLLNGKSPHAYLFAGPRGTGKTTLARLIAKAVNCENFMAEGDVCNRCVSCLAVEAGNHIDIVEIDAASNRGIEEIRQIRDTINFLPNAGKFKVYIIDEAHMLTREAFNALLKTLEEPPAHVIFIMATTEAHKVPVTILSRVQRFDLKLATPNQLKAKLTKIIESEGYKADPEILDILYTYSEGSYRDAESILGKILSSQEADKTITVTRLSEVLGIPSVALVQNLKQSLLSGNPSEALEIIENAAASGTDMSNLVKTTTSSLREEVVALAKKSEPYDRQLQVLYTLMGLQSEIKTVDDMRLLMDVAILKLGLQSANTKQKSQPQAAPPPAAAVAAIPDPIPVAKPAAVANKVKPAIVETAKPIPTDISANAEEKDIGGQWDRLISEMKKLDFKLWTVFKSCTGKLEGQNLRILTGYQSNVNLLQQQEVITKIRPLLNAVYSAETTIEPVYTGVTKPDFSAARSGGFADSNANLVEEMF